MQSQEKFSFLRTILRKLGLSPEAVDDIVERILDFLSEKEEKPSVTNYPYQLRDDFLSPAEQSFYLVLKNTVGDRVLIFLKVSLRNLFNARTKDPSQFRILTNKIDRKHVDFLICDLKTVRPLCAIELDDKSHAQAKRQERDEFVDRVFAVAKLPLLRVPVQRSYSGAALDTMLRPQLGPNGTELETPAPVKKVETLPDAPTESQKWPEPGTKVLGMFPLSQVQGVG